MAVGSREKRPNVAQDAPVIPLRPTEWSSSYKMVVVFLTSAMALIATMGILLSAPAAPQITTEFRASSSLDTILMITIWELGEAVSPVTLGPLSELFGRRLVYNTANALLVVFSVGAALSTSMGMLIAFRFLCGFSIASTVLNSCMVGDMYTTEQRGSALSWMSMTPFIGPVLGPVLGGVVSQHLGWRWTFWILSIAMGVVGLVFALVVRESYFPIILERQQRKDRNNASYIAAPTENAYRRLRTAILRPFVLLFTRPQIAIISLSWTVTLSYMQIVINTLNLAYDSVYHFSVSQIGLTYLGLACGLIGGALICSQTLDRYLKFQKARHGAFRAEDRLPPVMVGTGLSCISLIWFGWAVQAHTFWLVPILGTVLTGIGFTASAVGTQGFIVDTFGDHAASAIAGAIAIRNLVGAFFPLVGPVIWTRVGYGWGGTILGLVGLLVLPTPLLLFRIGTRLSRERSAGSGV